jgi:hypothetical protein
MSYFSVLPALRSVAKWSGWGREGRLRKIRKTCGTQKRVNSAGRKRKFFIMGGGGHASDALQFATPLPVLPGYVITVHKIVLAISSLLLNCVTV